jgi:hypothetical protein
MLLGIISSHKAANKRSNTLLVNFRRRKPIKTPIKAKKVFQVIHIALNISISIEALALYKV